MYYDQIYTIEIAKDSLKDASGNYMESDYLYKFTTEEPRIDIDNNSKIDIIDLAMVASKYNMTSTDTNWDSLYDFNGDKFIDIYDLIMVSIKID